MAAVTGAQILDFVGVKVPSTSDSDWADAVAGAVTAGATFLLNGKVPAPEADAELNVALLIAGAEAYKRKEATFGLTGYADMEGNAIRVAKDYMEGVKPVINRYSNGPGIG